MTPISYPFSDIGLFNLMMDESAVVPKGSHFVRPWTHDGCRNIISWRNRCAVAPIDYYYIDFGLSAQYHVGQNDALSLGKYRQVKNVPEHSDIVPYNPFKADVYQLGYTILKVIQVRI